MKDMLIKIKGITPMLLHSDAGVNPFHPLVKEMKALTGKRKKADEDRMEVARLEFMLALPVNSKGHPALPTFQIAACIRDGAKRTKNGKNCRSAIIINSEDGYVPLIYSGAKTAAELFKDDNFVDARAVVVQRARVIRTRPIFRKWAVEFSVSIDDSVVNDDEFLNWVDAAGQYCGIGDYRPEFGRFVREE